MSIYRLDTLFAPKSVAVVGASPTPRTLGHALLANLKRSAYAGRLVLVNPRHRDIEGLPCLRSVADIDGPVDLAVVATPVAAVPQVVADLARRGTRTCVVLTGARDQGPDGPQRLKEAVARIARPHGMRIVGPDSLGLAVPRAGLDASAGVAPVRAGDIALVSQSATVLTTIVDWAHVNSVGFSAVVSIGDKADVDFADLLDFFALDYRTRAILLYIEDIADPRKFMSAARAAARSKPVVVMKSGRYREGVRRASHAGALAAADAVYDAAFRRAGLLRVHDLGEMFDAAETLSRLKPFAGRRLAVVSNGIAPGILALDRLVGEGGAPAALSGETIAALDAVLPVCWSRANPVDIVGDADGPAYRATLDALIADPQVDAVLMMNAPSALASSVEAAEAVIAGVAAQRAKTPRPKPVLAAWLTHDESLHDLFEAAQIPHHRTPHDAVDGYLNVVRYSQAQDAMMETPPSLPEEFAPDLPKARAAVAAAIAAGRRWLDPAAVAEILAAYGIPVAPTEVAATPEEAGAIARRLLVPGARCVIKILSQDLPHKSDVGGVRLDLASAEAVEDAAHGMLARIAKLRPDARVEGIAVQPMVDRPRAFELIAGITDDPVFGPVVVFGRGGTAVEVLDDKALALPPLDLRLARELMAGTRVDRLLHGWRGQPPADHAGVALVLVKLAQLAADIPEIREIDLNPLLADERETIALDAKIAVAPCAPARGVPFNPRFAVRPYPKEWERHDVLRDGTKVFVRPVRPEDERLYPDFFKAVTAEDLRLRFFAPVKDFSHAFIARLTQLDYSRAIAFAAIEEASGDLWGVVRLHADPDHETGEYAILLRSDLKGKGLGWLLMQRMIDWGRADGLKWVKGQVLRENTTMLVMCEKLGFEVRDDPEDPGIKVVKLPLDHDARVAAE